MSCPAKYYWLNMSWNWDEQDDGLCSFLVVFKL